VVLADGHRSAIYLAEHVGDDAERGDQVALSQAGGDAGRVAVAARHQRLDLHRAFNFDLEGGADVLRRVFLANLFDHLLADDDQQRIDALRIHAAVIADEGPGFNTSALPAPTDPENMRKATGRGLFLIRTFLVEVKFNAAGNEITLVKRKKE
jgi:hypothetical protein